MSYDNTNRGQIWKNDKKESDKHPDFKGSVNVEGVEYWVSAWKRRPDANPKSPALTFALKPKDQGAQHQPPQGQGGGAPDAEDIPFNRITGLESLAM